MSSRSLTPQDLDQTLTRLDGRGYKAYKSLAGTYAFPGFRLIIDHVQGDPFASPSRLRAIVDHSQARFPEDTYHNRSRRIGLADFLLRRFYRLAVSASKLCGSGKSGIITIDRPGQEILERTAVIVTQKSIEARFAVGLPARGRSILAREAKHILLKAVPEIIGKTLFFTELAPPNGISSSSTVGELYRHIETNEDADYLREALASQDLVAFVSNGAVLPRRSGVDDRPKTTGRVVRFESPPSLRVSFDLPNHGTISGMGIAKGITLIVGGGYHGKSTLLNAIERGVYNHIPGDGREFVVTHPSAVKIRAEDGRRIEKVNISPFISNLPYGEDTTRFSTENASGSTSQAANIVEALEAGAKVLLTDEDTAATNFMIRDHRMQELIAKSKEPITPFVDKVRQLYEDLGVSTILVMGGSGDYFDVADCVIAMDAFRANDVSEQARAIATKYRSERRPEGGEHFGEITPRVPLRQSLDASKGKREVKISGRGLKTIVFGRYTIDLSCVEGLVHPSQVNAIGQALYYARTKYMDGKRTLPEILDCVMSDIDNYGLDVIDPRRMGDYARFRKVELAAALNRLPTLRVL